jgi:hypothetical protein
MEVITVTYQGDVVAAAKCFGLRLFDVYFRPISP